MRAVFCLTLLSLAGVGCGPQLPTAPADPAGCSGAACADDPLETAPPDDDQPGDDVDPCADMLATYPDATVCDGDHYVGIPTSTLSSSWTVHPVNDLSAMLECEVVTGRVEVHSDALSALAGLSSLRAVCGDLKLMGPPNHDLAPLSRLTHVGERLSVSYSSLASLHGLEQLVSVGKLDLRLLPDLVDLAPLAQLAHADEVVLADLHQLEDFATFPPGVTTVERLEVRDDEILLWGEPDPIKTLAGLDAITHVGQRLELDIVGDVDLSALGHVTVAGAMHLRLGNHSIAALHTADLSAVNRVVVEESPNLYSPLGLGSLGPSLQHLEFEETSIRSLDGLEGVTAIGTLRLHDNPCLENLNGLENLTQVGNLYITENLALPDTQLDALLDRVEVENTVVVDGNSTGGPDCD